MDQMHGQTDTDAVTLFSEQLQSALRKEYGCDFEPVKCLAGGYESAVLLLNTDDGLRVLKIAPEWRSREELEWSFAAAVHASLGLSEAIAPFLTYRGKCVVLFEGRSLSLWPFIEGRNLNTSDQAECDQVAAIYARLQNSLAQWTYSRKRPPTSPLALVVSRSSYEPDTLKDPLLDAWLTEWRKNRRQVGPIHGDFWCNNLMFADGKISGILDWDDTRIGSLEREFAWTVWEFCADKKLAELDINRALRFLSIYRASGGPVPLKDISFIVPLVREHLRYEVRRVLGAAENGQAIGVDQLGYIASEERAFKNLKAQELIMANVKSLKPDAFSV
jgi:Ser/Thr protein kinase RdoA (MazF antagonist)